MTGRWSSQVKKMEFKDLQANAMAVDCTGKLVLLAGRRSLGIVNLEQTTDVPEFKRVPRQSKWDVSAAQWNPLKSHANVFVTACNQRADVWSWDDSRTSTSAIASLRGHTRVISDLDWSPSEGNLLATCSGDAYAFLWDIRDPKKPVVSMQAVVGASQVKWNKKNMKLLATAHDGDIRIWDPRKATTPLHYIAAHLSKIHGLDWSPISETSLASSSQDCTVKLWDINNPKSPETKLAWSSPVWRARFTPHGDGLATVMVPQLRRGENSLLLWRRNDLKQPVHTFMGHQDVVLEFHWRHLRDSSGEYQLVSWSRDQSLRLWKIEPNIDKSDAFSLPGSNATSPPDSGDSLPSVTHSGIDIPKPPHISTDSALSHDLAKDVAFTPPQTGSLSRRDEMQSPQQPKCLDHEFALVNFHIPNVTVEEMDPVHRTFTASAHVRKSVVKLTMLFPDSYPKNERPTFSFEEETTVDQHMQDKLHKVLEDTSLQYVRHSRSCIEPCLRQLVSSLQHFTEGQQDQEIPTYMLAQPPIPSQRFLSFYSGGFQEPVPFPRTCGARFCGAGYLVCFTKPVDSTTMRRTSSSIEFMPRTMSSYGAYSQGSRTPQGSSAMRGIFAMGRSPPATDSILSSFHRDLAYKDRKPRSRSKSRARDTHMADGKLHDSKKLKTGPVVIYNISCMMPVNQQLAESYVMDGDDLPSVCKKNAAAALAAGRRDLVQVWSMASLATNKSLKPDPDPDKGQPWAMHPFGRKLVNSLLQHYSGMYDVQTLAMLCCVFGDKYDPDKPQHIPKITKAADNVPNGDTFLGLPPSSILIPTWGTSPTSMTRIRRSNSWSSLTNGATQEEGKDPAQKEKEKHEQNMKLLDPNHVQNYDQYKRAYADLLYRWRLFGKRAEVLKYVSVPAEPHKGIEFGADCQHCHKEVRGAQCWHCKNYVLQCVICHTSVKGSSSFCLACGHGGHTAHMTEWFQKHAVCPTGCGCLCLEDNPMSVIGGD